MDNQLNSKLQLINLSKKLNDFDIQLLLAFATGYEAGKKSQILSIKSINSLKNLVYNKKE